MAKLNFEVDWEHEKGPRWYRKTKEYHGPVIFEIRKSSTDVMLQDEWGQLRNLAREIERWLDEKTRRISSIKKRFQDSEGGNHMFCV